MDKDFILQIVEQMDEDELNEFNKTLNILDLRSAISECIMESTDSVYIDNICTYLRDIY